MDSNCRWSTGRWVSGCHWSTAWSVRRPTTGRQHRVAPPTTSEWSPTTWRRYPQISRTPTCHDLSPAYPAPSSPSTPEVRDRHGTGPLGHRVNGSFGSSFTSGSPSHRVIILTRCETRVFPVFEKNAQNAKRTFEMLKWQKSLSAVCCWTEITGCQSMQWTFTFTYDYYKFFGLRILLHT